MQVNIDNVGRPQIDSNSLFEIIYTGNRNPLPVADGPAIRQFKTMSIKFNLDWPYTTVDESVSEEEYVSRCVDNWVMPKEYYEIDLEQYFAQRIGSVVEAERVQQNLIKTIAGEKAEQIFTTIYDTIPSYLLPEKADGQTKNLPSNPADAMTNGMMNNGDKQEGKVNSMDNMASGQMNPMNNLNGMPGMNTNGNTIKTAGSGTLNEQLINQLQSSNAILIQMFASLEQKNGVSQTQIQPILQLLTSQETLVRLLSTNLSTADTSSGSSGSSSGNTNTGKN